jgi:UDPglucose 6-dehydrogenase
VEQVNDRQKNVLVEKMQRHFGSLKGKTIAIWGLAFKPRTDDMREAPSINIIQSLLKQGATVQAYDPEAAETARRHFGNKITYGKKGYDVLAGADALALITEWNEFREPDYARMKKLMRQPVVFDGRNIYNATAMKAQGFTYFSIGRTR